MGDDPVIQLENASFRHGEGVVFRRTNWSIYPGQQWAVVGPNGSGKSFLARALRGEVPTCEGDISYDFSANGGVDRRTNGEWLPEDEIAVVSLDTQRDLIRSQSDYYQSRWHSSEGEDCPTVQKALSRDHIEGILPSQIVVRGAIDREYASRRRTAVQLLDIGHLLRRKILHLSNGETRKVLLARALMQKPSILVLDDPFLGLDGESRRSLRRVIRDLIQDGLQVLLITPRRAEILPGITHLLCVNHMRVVAQGSRREMLQTAGIGKLFGGETEARDGSRSGRSKAAVPPESESRELIRLNGVTVRYGSVVVLESVDWVVRKGQHWALVGPNGSGKTTLLSLITGDNPQAYSNDVSVFGKRRGTGESIWGLKRKIGFVSPELLLHYPPDTACYGVVCSGFFDSIGLYRTCSPQQRRRADDCVRRLRLSQVRDQAFGSVSNSWQRLVLLARALVKDPSVLVLDEPCQGLDAKNRRRILRVVNGIGERGEADLIYITHHLDEVPDCITHAIRLQNGRAVRSGTRKAVLGR